MNKQTLSIPLTLLFFTLTLQASQPNIIFIITDDHGYNDLPTTDLLNEVNMPNIQRLSNNGALMTQAYCSSPQCVPSRAGIVTGRHQQRFNLESNGDGPLPTSQKTIASRLQSLGYKTGHVGKWHLKVNKGTTDWLQQNNYKSIAAVPDAAINAFGPQNFGYNDVAEGTGTKLWSNFDIQGNSFPLKEINYGFHDRKAHAKKFRLQIQTELALAFINRHIDTPNPFFLYLAYYGPHAPLDAPPSLTNQVLTLKQLQAKGYDNTKPVYKKSAIYAKNYTAAEIRQQGLALLKGIDHGVGDIYELLLQKKQLQNTLIFFMSDNGAPTSIKSWNGSLNTPWHGSKGIIFEGGSRIPYIVHWNKTIPPQIFDKGVTTLDAGATAIAVAGADPSTDPTLDGVNLIPYLTGKNTAAPHRYLYQRYMNTASIIQGKLKFMRHENGEELLFDITMQNPTAYNPDIDFHESQNLIAQMPKQADHLRQQLESWMQALPTPHYQGGFHSSLYDFINRRWGFRKNTNPK